MGVFYQAADERPLPCMKNFSDIKKGKNLFYDI
jgi:hypothetical protein